MMAPCCKLICWVLTFSSITKSMSFSLCDCILMFVCVRPTGAISSGLRLEDSPFYDFLSPGPSPLSPPGQSMGSVGDGWPPRANSPPPHGNTVTWPPGTHPFTCTDKQNKTFALKTANRCVCVCVFVCVCRVPARGALERLPQHWPWDWPLCDPRQCHQQPLHQHRPRHRPPQGQEQR